MFANATRFVKVEELRRSKHQGRARGADHWRCINIQLIILSISILSRFDIYMIRKAVRRVQLYLLYYKDLSRRFDQTRAVRDIDWKTA